MNKLEFYRRGLKISMEEMAEVLNYSRQWYRKKEKKIDFTDSEKSKITKYFKKIDKSITKEDIFD